MNEKSIISVVIAFYQGEQFLENAIRSVMNQTYSNWELILVDDGSTDKSTDIALSYADKYRGRIFYKNHDRHRNKGLSFSRNLGVDAANGEYIVFLDVDDVLCDDALRVNLSYFEKYPYAAFVSGSNKKITRNNVVLDFQKYIILNHHYLHFLQLNYIGIHSAVMYQSWVVREMPFDVSLQACEDYDMFLKVSRIYPVIHHLDLVVISTIHEKNISTNNILMLDSGLKVLRRQKSILQSKEEKQCLVIGTALWKNTYCENIFSRLVSGQNNGVDKWRKDLLLLTRYRPSFLLSLLRIRLGSLRKSGSYPTLKNWWKEQLELPGK